MYSNKVRAYLIITLVALWAVAFVLSIRGNQDKKLYYQERLMMGTFVQVISPEPKAAKIVFDEIGRLERLLSKYDPQSEVSKLNASGYLKASPETFYVVKRSKEFWLLTEGAFDITIAPLMDLWGFTNRQYRKPSAAKIKETLKLTGSDKIILQDFDNVIQFKLSDTRIDLGAIAKGYSLDCAAKKLKEAGINSCLINTGGQIYCLGQRFGKSWGIGVAASRSKNLAGILKLENGAVATSGDSEQYFIKNKKRYSHILDPKTGFPAESGLSSVTVAAKDGLTADALATAIFVLGRDKGEKLAKRFNGVEVKFIQESGEKN